MQKTMSTRAMSAELSETADSVPVACPISRLTTGTRGHSWTAGYTGSRAKKQADPLRKPTF
jgi:hypothetical protein